MRLRITRRSRERTAGIIFILICIFHTEGESERETKGGKQKRRFPYHPRIMLWSPMITRPGNQTRKMLSTVFFFLYTTSHLFICIVRFLSLFVKDILRPARRWRTGPPFFSPPPLCSLIYKRPRIFFLTPSSHISLSKRVCIYIYAYIISSLFCRVDWTYNGPLSY